MANQNRVFVFSYFQRPWTQEFHQHSIPLHQKRTSSVNDFKSYPMTNTHTQTFPRQHVGGLLAAMTTNWPQMTRQRVLTVRRRKVPVLSAHAPSDHASCHKYLQIQTESHFLFMSVFCVYSMFYNNGVCLSGCHARKDLLTYLLQTTATRAVQSSALLTRMALTSTVITWKQSREAKAWTTTCLSSLVVVGVLPETKCT